MTDEDLVRKKLAFIETCLRDLRETAAPERIESDIKERRFIEHTLQICIQAVQDVGLHIVADEKLGEPRTNADLFQLLANAYWISTEQAANLKSIIGFRNVLVHGYTAVDTSILRDVVENRLNDLQKFVDLIRTRI